MNPAIMEAAFAKMAELRQESVRQMKSLSLEEFKKVNWDFILESVENNIPENQIIATLVERGYQEEQARDMLTETAAKIRERIKFHDNLMLIGIIGFIAGLLVTIVTFEQAMHGGGWYLVAWGAILYGPAQVIGSSAQKKRYRKLLAKYESLSDTPAA